MRRIAEQREYIGTTILDQLACTSGGAGADRLRAMVGASNITTLSASADHWAATAGSAGIKFRFKGCKDWNGVEIFYDYYSDEYVARFSRRGRAITFASWERYYAAELCAMFTGYTGLETHLYGEA